MNFSLGRCRLEFTQALSSVALAWHKAGGSTPLGVTLNVWGFDKAEVHMIAPTTTTTTTMTTTTILALSFDSTHDE